MVAVHTFSHIGRHFLQKSIVGQAGTGFNFNGNLAVLPFNFLREISGLTDFRHQFPHHLAGFLALISGIIRQDFTAVVIASFYLGYLAVPIVKNGDFRIHAQVQRPAGSQRNRTGAAALTALLIAAHTAAFAAALCNSRCFAAACQKYHTRHQCQRYRGNESLLHTLYSPLHQKFFW